MDDNKQTTPIQNTSNNNVSVPTTKTGAVNNTNSGSVLLDENIDVEKLEKEFQTQLDAPVIENKPLIGGLSQNNPSVLEKNDLEENMKELENTKTDVEKRIKELNEKVKKELEELKKMKEEIGGEIKKIKDLEETELQINKKIDEIKELEKTKAKIEEDVNILKAGVKNSL